MTATITIHGGLTAAPELRYSQNGLPIVGGTVASTDRYLDRQTNEWKDGKTLYVRYTAFKDLAEHIAASGLDKGSQVVVTGKLHTRSYDDREGVKRTSTELEVIDFAVSLRRATAQVTRAASTGVQSAPNQGAAVSEEPWQTPGEQTGTWATQGGLGDDAPF
ncbi:single-stranded DNA-binding protein [Microbacterium sp. p3-SID338]|uniref:single-stranded DNA-binding protein n=1 Tax=Microbacterium sp. p3-SID338 TaxID=2916214 RepID=UPI0021A611E4|nr:single-stranded DNA-binding protein [Microbacterium sp. p3-SID338]MCT1395648.1 single-stranded DNA-binding protein [Microbacterium sp. p3-SID338]